MFTWLIKHLFNNNKKYDELRAQYAKAREETIVKSKKLKEDIGQLYKIASALNNTEYNLNYFMMQNNLSAIIIFDKNKKVIRIQWWSKTLFQKEKHWNI